MTQHKEDVPVNLHSRNRLSLRLDSVSTSRSGQSRATRIRKRALLRSCNSPVLPSRSIRITNLFQDRNALVLLLKQHGGHLIEKITLHMRCEALKSLDKLQFLHDTTTTPSKMAASFVTATAAPPVANMALLSNAAQELLSGKLTGPATKQVEIECGLDLQTDGAAQFEREVERLFLQTKDEEILQQLEAEDTRRRLLADTWAALALNTAVRELTVNRFVPVWTSAFHRDAFRALLGRLESLHINIYGTRNGNRRINTVSAYRDSLQSMLKVLFLHSSSLKRLSLHASQHALLGSRGPYHIPLSLKATQLPHLEHLSIKNCFIGFELAHFINGHTATLRSLELHNCYSYRGAGDNDEAGGMSWAAFLAMITRPTLNLRHFAIIDDHIPLTIDDPRLAKYNPDSADEPEDVKNVRRAQKARPQTRLFLYGFLREYSGELWMNKDAILGSFDAEDDQTAYDKLMEEMERIASGKGAGEGGDVLSEKRCTAVHATPVVELPA